MIDGFIADFYCHAAGLVVEVDGSIHQQQAEYDMERGRILEKWGLRILRFSNDQVEQDCPAVLAQIMKAANE